jgi:amino acid transporter
MTDYDATAHIAEEAKNPAVVVPRAIASALTFTYVVGWLFNIVLVFCMGDPAIILDSPIAQPVSQAPPNHTCPQLTWWLRLSKFSSKLWVKDPPSSSLWPPSSF